MSEMTFLKEEFWIIEHASYGSLVEWDRTYLKPRPKFRWSGYRSESIRYQTLQHAEKQLYLARASGKRGMHSAYILHYCQDWRGYWTYNRLDEEKF